MPRGLLAIAVFLLWSLFSFSQTSPTSKNSAAPTPTPALAVPSPSQPPVIRVEPAGPLQLVSGKPPAWTYLVPVVGPLISGLLAFLGAWAGLRIAQRNTLQTVEVSQKTSQAAIWQKANETELRDIQEKLDKFYGPLLIRLKADHLFAQDIRTRQPAGYRLLLSLFEPSWLQNLSAGDHKLVGLICENARILESLIADNAGIMDKRLVKYFSRAINHFRVLQLAYKGELGTDSRRFEAYVYPKQLDQILQLEVERLNRRVAHLRANPAVSPGPLPELDLSGTDPLVEWPDPDNRLREV